MANEDKLRDYLKRVTTDLAQTRERLRDIEERQQEPIAIVGMSCRFPGGADSPEAFWRLLAEGRDAVAAFPENRGWDLDTLFDPDPDHAGTSYVDVGGFLYDAAEFDPEFFGISPREALAMDPQQRLLMQAGWEALEHARIDPATLRGSQTGVFTGAFALGYGSGTPGDLDVGPQEGESSEGFLMTGIAASVFAGRVSFALGLQGPAVTLDTACSSSLVALHLACHSLRSGESTLALVSGATVHSTPGIFIEFSRQGGLAGDGRCKAYSDDADGTGWGEGVGVLVVERLSDAVRNGHRVLALVRGSAVNQDGASNGLTAPNGQAQQRVIRAALTNAGLSPAEVDVIEGHGTGTALGDPIEAQALLATYGRDRDPERPLLLGSVKSNIGHTLAAAGVAGIIKMVEAMRRGTVPATLHAHQPSTNVDWSAQTVRLVSEPVAWPETGRARRAAVSSFGISGTNCHVILEQAPESDSAPVSQGSVLTQGSVCPVWMLSGRGEAALAAQAQRLGECVEDADEVAVGAALSARSAFEHRAVAMGDLRAGLAAVARGEEAAGVVVGTADAVGGVAFVFSGQGAQRLGMGAELHARHPVFAAKFDEVCAELDRALGDAASDTVSDTASVASVVHGLDPALVNETVWAQSGLFAIEVALCELLASWGVTPQLLAGHSIGELAAAHVAGVFSLPDACAVVAARGRLMQQLPRGGAMAAVAASEAAVAAVLARCGERVAIAAVNAPESVVVSGDEAGVEQAVAELTEAGVRCKRLRVSHAFHSPLMDPMLAEFEAVVAGVGLNPPRLALVSGLTGALVSDEVTDPRYWVRHVREAVRFGDAVTALRTAGARTFVEIGPDAALTPMAAAADGEAWLPALRRQRPETESLVAAVAGLWVRGGAADWPRYYEGCDAPGIDLPTYAFQRRHFWLSKAAGAGDVVGLGLAGAGHGLLGAALDVPETGGTLLTGRLSLQAQRWLRECTVGGVAVVPSAALVEMAVRAGDEVGCGRVAALTVETPLTVPDSGGVQVQVAIGAAGEDGAREVALYARPDADGAAWVRHVAGFLEPEPETVADPGLTRWPPAGAEQIDVAEFYDRPGFDLGPVFRGVRAAWARDGEVFAEITLPDGVGASEFGVHPALLDAAVQVTALTGGDAGGGFPGRPQAAYEWSDVQVHAVDAVTARVRVTPVSDGSDGSDGSGAAGRPDGYRIALADATGGLIASVGTVRIADLPADVSDTGAALAREALFRVSWQPLPVAAAETGGEDWAVIGADPGFGLPRAAAYADLAALTKAVAAGAPAPKTVLVCAADQDSDTAPHAARGAVVGVQELVQSWLTAPGLTTSRLAVVTRRAVDAGADAAVRPGVAGVWGLVRVAASENPGRIAAVDVDAPAGSGPSIVAGLAVGETEFAVRSGQIRVPRLVRAERGLAAPDGDWRLGYESQGTLEHLRLVTGQDSATPLEAGQVRIAVRAAGVNFRDVLTVLGVYPGPAGPLGLEGAGVVVELGPGVERFAVGDAVAGLFAEAFGPVAVADVRTLIPMPAGWTFAEAAALPVAFVTAYHALVELAGVEAGESVLVHAAAGGVGGAAVQLARHLGAEVHATASPAKWSAVHGLGVPRDQIASSRTPGFADVFSGVDVVVNSLTGELVDASLRALRPGGRFVELGKTDLREDVGDAVYLLPDLLAEGEADRTDRTDRIGRILERISALIASGVLHPLPVTCWDVRRAADAFRFLSQGLNVGKVVLTLPAPREKGTVLVTGASGALGGLVARHLVAGGHAESLILASRRGANAGGVAELAAELAAVGARVELVACDVAERDQVAEILGSLERRGVRLSGIMHTAGVLDDSVLGSLTAERTEAVLRPKLDGAWHLHELTRDMDLDSFVMFSSVAGILGAAGQANYAAGNTFLDALAAHRQRAGLPAVSVAWGPWHLEDATGGMAGTLDRSHRERMARQGLAPLSGSDGLALLDRARDADDSLLVAARLDLARLSRQGADRLPLFANLVRRVPGRAAAAPNAALAQQGLAERLAVLSKADQQEALRAIVRTQIALVLGIAGQQGVDTHRTFRELGFDSLTAVELRNRLTAATGLPLPATMIFDYPTPDDLAEYLRAQTVGASDGADDAAPLLKELDRFQALLAARPAENPLKLITRLEGILQDLRTGGSANAQDSQEIEDATDDEMFSLIDRELGLLG